MNKREINKIEKLKKLIKAFSMIEILLALIAITTITAAFAPVISKKIKSSAIITSLGNATINCSGQFGNNCLLCDNEKCLICNKECSGGQRVEITSCSCIDCEEGDRSCDAGCEEGIVRANDDPVCTKCHSGYKLINKSCVSCGVEGCGHYSSGCTCDACAAGYYMNNGNCVSCGVEGCAHYSSGCTCDACAGGYELSIFSGTCNQCSEYSSQGCTSYTTNKCYCESCANGYRLFGNIGWASCVDCKQQSQYIGCSTYEADSCSCLNCTNGYSRWFDGISYQCSACDTIENCAHYVDNGCLCETCADGYQIAYSGYGCQSCGIEGCTHYSSGCTCDTCADGYQLNNGTCVSCGAGCTHYSSGCTCDTCTTGYELNNGVCVNCQEINPNCSTYQDGSCDCSTCNSGYKLYNNYRCVVCSDEFPRGCKVWSDNLSTCYCSKPAYGWVADWRTNYVPMSCGEFLLPSLGTGYEIMEYTGVCEKKIFWDWRNPAISLFCEPSPRRHRSYAAIYEDSTCTGPSRVIEHVYGVSGQDDTWTLDELLDPMMGED